jgi:hypothetical protein
LILLHYDLGVTFVFLGAAEAGGIDQAEKNRRLIPSPMLIAKIRPFDMTVLYFFRKKLQRKIS